MGYGGGLSYGVNGPLTPALPGRRIALGEREPFGGVAYIAWLL